MCSSIGRAAVSKAAGWGFETLRTRRQWYERMEKIVDLKEEKASLKKRFKLGFLSELKAEFRKISWTPKEELFQCTKIVVAFVFVFGFGIYFADLLIKGGLNWLDFVVHKVFG